MVDRTIRGIDDSLLKEANSLTAAKYGSSYGREGEIINEALRLWIESERKQHHSTSFARSFFDIQKNGKVRTDVIQRIEQFKLYLISENIGNFDIRGFPELIREATKGKVNDNRTIAKYRDLLINDGRLRREGYRLVVNTEWIGDLAKPDYEQPIAQKLETDLR